MTIPPIRQLYQQLRKDYPNLVEALDRIVLALQDLSAEIPALQETVTTTTEGYAIPDVSNIQLISLTPIEADSANLTGDIVAETKLSYISPNPPGDPPYDFKGVDTYIATPDGRVQAGGSHGYYDFPGGTGYVTLVTPYPRQTETWRIYLASRSDTFSNKFDPKHTPYIDVQMPADPLLGPAPDVVYFFAGTVDSNGNWTLEMSWDSIREKMRIDWAALAPEDRMNWSGIAVYVRTPLAVGYYWQRVTGILGLQFFHEQDGDHYLYSDTPMLFDSGAIPNPPEQWRFTCVSYNRKGEPNLDDNGDPTGPYVDLWTLGGRGQLTNLAATIGEYGWDGTTQPAKPVARIHVTYTNPYDADDKTYFDFWTYITDTSITNPPDAAKFEYRASMRHDANRTDVDMWVDRPPVGDPTQRYWIRGVTCDEFYSGPPNNDTPICYVDVHAPSAPAQVTGFSLTRNDLGGSLPIFTVSINYTRPNDLEFWYSLVERIACDSNYNPLSGAEWGHFMEVGANATPGVPNSELALQGGQGYPTDAPEYWKMRASSHSRANIQNDTDPPTATLYIPTLSEILALRPQLSNLTATIGEYGWDAATQPGKPVARIHVTYTNPNGADEHTYFDFWTYSTDTSVINPPDSAKFEYRASMRWETGRIDVDIWEDRPAVGAATERLWIRGVTCDEFYSGPPDNDSPVCYVDVTAPGAPAQVTGFTITLTNLSTPANSFKLTANFTIPNDLEFWYAGIDRIACDSNYNPLPGEIWAKVCEVGANAIPGVPAHEDIESRVYPATAMEYWKYRAKSFSRAGIRNDAYPPTTIIAIPTIATIQGSAVVNIPTASFASNIRPVTLVTSNPSLPSGLYPPGTLAYNTATHRLIRVNDAGNLWQEAIDGGYDIVADSITSGQIAAGAIRTEELYAGELLVGQGGGKPIRFKVVDTFGSMLAFIGDDSNIPFCGGYFKNIKIGPTIYDIRIEASGSGVSITGATFVLSLNGITTKIDHSSPEGYPAGIQVYDASNNRVDVGISGSIPRVYLRSFTYGGSISIFAGAGGYIFLTDSTGTSGMELEGEYYSSGSWRGHITTGGANFIRSLSVNSVDVVDSLSRFVGCGVSCPGYSIGGAQHNTFYSGGWYYGSTGPVPYKKPDDSTGYMWFYGGIFTGLS